LPLGHFLTEPQLTTVRTALPEPFNHFSTDYDYIARQIRGVDPAVLYEIFYLEVAPVCFTNIAAVLPAVSTGFVRLGSVIETPWERQCAPNDRLHKPKDTLKVARFTTSTTSAP